MKNFFSFLKWSSLLAFVDVGGPKNCLLLKESSNCQVCQNLQSVKMKVVGLLILVLPAVLCYDYEHGPVPKEGLFPCPGFFCGRSDLNETHYSRFESSTFVLMVGVELTRSSNFSSFEHSRVLDVKFGSGSSPSMLGCQEPIIVPGPTGSGMGPFQL